MKIRQNWAFLSLLLLFCGSGEALAEVKLFACEPEWAALARELGGERLSITSATTALQDPHHIQARPSLIAKIRRADLLVCSGADLEIGWLPVLLRKSANAEIQPGSRGYFIATEQVELLGKPTVLDRSMGDVHMAGNPHIQFDPYRIMQVARALAARLTEIDQGHQAQYEANLLTFLSRWQSAIQRWESETKALQGRSMVVQHESWIYLRQWLGLKQLATLEPKPGVPPNAGHLAKVLATVKKDRPDMIIYASYQSKKAAQWLAAKTGAPAVSVPFSVDADESLIEWYDRFLHLLLKAQS